MCYYVSVATDSGFPHCLYARIGLPVGAINKIPQNSTGGVRSSNALVCKPVETSRRPVETIGVPFGWLRACPGPDPGVNGKTSAYSKNRKTFG